MQWFINYNFIVYYGDPKYWIDNVDKDLYSYLKIITDLYEIIDKKNIKRTIISCGNEFFIKNDNDVIYIFSTCIKELRKYIYLLKLILII